MVNTPEEMLFEGWKDGHTNGGFVLGEGCFG